MLLCNEQKIKTVMQEMNYVSLFSSAGVGCYGFKQQGFECAATSELIERRLRIQKINNKAKYQDGYILGDITNIEKKQELYDSINKFKKRENEEEIDVVIFTAPCQGMSVANHKKNDGTILKNSLVVESLEIVKFIKPKFFVAENVRSFMNTICIDHNKRIQIKDAFRNWLADDYEYESRVINFKEYGANSSRTRTLVIGVRKDINKPHLIENLFPNKTNVKTLKEVIGHLPSLKTMGEISSTDIYHNFKEYRKNMRSWISELKEGENAFDNINPLNRPHKIIDNKVIFNVNKNGDKYKRQSWNKVAPCIHTRNDIISSQNTVHPVDDRVFSIRELMLMMNIPNDFNWIEGYSETELNLLNDEEKRKILKANEINIRQSIGEAVPPIIFEKIAANIKDVIKNEDFREENKKNYKQLQFTI